MGTWDNLNAGLSGALQGVQIFNAVSDAWDKGSYRRRSKQNDEERQHELDAEAADYAELQRGREEGVPAYKEYGLPQENVDADPNNPPVLEPPERSVGSRIKSALFGEQKPDIASAARRLGLRASGAYDPTAVSRYEAARSDKRQAILDKYAARQSNINLDYAVAQGDMDAAAKYRKEITDAEFKQWGRGLVSGMVNGDPKAIETVVKSAESHFGKNVGVLMEKNGTITLYNKATGDVLAEEYQFSPDMVKVATQMAIADEEYRRTGDYDTYMNRVNILTKQRNDILKSQKGGGWTVGEDGELEFNYPSGKSGGSGSGGSGKLMNSPDGTGVLQNNNANAGVTHFTANGMAIPPGMTEEQMQQMEAAYAQKYGAGGTSQWIGDKDGNNQRLVYKTRGGMLVDFKTGEEITVVPREAQAQRLSPYGIGKKSKRNIFKEREAAKKKAEGEQEAPSEGAPSATGAARKEEPKEPVADAVPEEAVSEEEIAETRALQQSAKSRVQQAVDAQNEAKLSYLSERFPKYTPDTEGTSGVRMDKKDVAPSRVLRAHKEAVEARKALAEKQAPSGKVDSDVKDVLGGTGYHRGGIRDGEVPDDPNYEQSYYGGEPTKWSPNQSRVLRAMKAESTEGRGTGRSTDLDDALDAAASGKEPEKKPVATKISGSVIKSAEKSKPVTPQVNYMGSPVANAKESERQKKSAEDAKKYNWPETRIKGVTENIEKTRRVRTKQKTKPKDPGHYQDDNRSEKIIMGHEKFRPNAYPDNTTASIGFGTNMKNHPELWARYQREGKNMTITKKEAYKYFKKDYDESVRDVKNLVKVPITQEEWDALVDFRYNRGSAAFKDSSILKSLNAGNFAEAKDHWARWHMFTRNDKNEHVLNRGLADRRWFFTKMGIFNREEE